MDTITLVCSGCGKRVPTPRDKLDPPNATELHGIECPDCDSGGFDMPAYFDANGSEVCGDPERWETGHD